MFRSRRNAAEESVTVRWNLRPCFARFLISPVHVHCSRFKKSLFQHLDSIIFRNRSSPPSRITILSPFIFIRKKTKKKRKNFRKPRHTIVYIYIYISSTIRTKPRTEEVLKRPKISRIEKRRKNNKPKKPLSPSPSPWERISGRAERTHSLDGLS